LNWIVKGILGGLGAMMLALPLHAFNVPSVMLGQSSCTGCHGGTIGFVGYGTSFGVEDPDTDVLLTSGSEYIPGKTYRLRVSFDPISTEVAFKLQAVSPSTGQPQGDLIDIAGDPGVAGTAFSGNGATMAARIEAAAPAGAEDVFVDWIAPDDGKTVLFKWIRVESNNNGANSGDAASSEEQFQLKGPNSVQGSSEFDGDIDENSEDGGDGSGSFARGSEFDNDFAAACGVVQSHSNSFDWFAFLVAMAGVFLILGAPMRAFRKKSS
jgi:hypothetical protein